jgi:F-box domain
MSRLQDLPSELILEIQSYLSLGDLNNLSDCSRSLRRLNSNLKQGIDLSPLSMILDDEILQILISTNFKSTRLPNSKLNWVNISNCDRVTDWKPLEAFLQDKAIRFLDSVGHVRVLKKKVNAPTFSRHK